MSVLLNNIITFPVISSGLEAGKLKRESKALLILFYESSTVSRTLHSKALGRSETFKSYRNSRILVNLWRFLIAVYQIKFVCLSDIVTVLCLAKVNVYF